MKSVQPSSRLQLSLLSGVALVVAGSTAHSAETKVPRPQAVQDGVKRPAPAIQQVKLPANPAELNAPSAAQVALPPKTDMLGTAPALAMPNRFAQPHYDVAADGSVWVRGATYKAQFTPAGATYIPFFGSAAPTNYPLAITVLDATVGGQTLGVAAAPAQRAGNQIDYARGAFVERYQVNASSIEQQFVFDSLPMGGDLVMTVGFQSELEAQQTASGLQFSNALGHVSYGNATLIDAEGQRTAIPGVWLEGSLELRVSASDLASAAFPITIDPVVTTYGLDLTSIDDFHADVAYTATSGVYCVVYEETYSATDHDVYGVTHDNAGNPVTGAYFDYTTSYWGDPSIAANAIGDNFLVVAAVGSPTGGARQIWGRIGSAGLGFGAQFQIDSNEIGDKLAPDVGGDPVTAPPTYFLAVWERVYAVGDTDVHARLIDSAGVLAGTGTILLEDSSGTIDGKPSVSKSDGQAPFSTQNWHVVWQRDFSPTDRDIYGAAILWDGTVTQTTYLIDYSGLDDTFPQVSSQLDDTGTRPALVTYARGSAGAQDIIGTVVASGVVLSQSNNISGFGGWGANDQTEPAVDSDGSNFAVVYAEQFSGADYDIYVDGLTYSAGTLSGCDLHQNLDFSGFYERSPGITSAYSGNGAKVRFATAWDRDHELGLGDIYGGLYDGCGAAVPPVAYCFGDGSGTACPCGNTGAAGNGCASSVNPAGGNLAASGTSSIGSDTLVLTGSGMPISSALYYQGTTQIANAFGDGIRCAGGSVVRLGTKQNVGGSSQYPAPGDPSISVRGNNVAGNVRNYQCWYRNAANFCTAATFNLTNGINVTWTP